MVFPFSQVYAHADLVLVWAQSPHLLVAAGLPQGFFYIGGPIGGAMEREMVSADQMGRWLGITRFFRMLVGVLMAMIAGIAWDRIGPQYVFLGFVALDLVVRMPLLLGMPKTVRAGTGSLKSE